MTAPVWEVSRFGVFPVCELLLYIVVIMYSFRTHKEKLCINSGNAYILIFQLQLQL